MHWRGARAVGAQTHASSRDGSRLSLPVACALWYENVGVLPTAAITGTLPGSVGSV